METSTNALTMNQKYENLNAWKIKTSNGRRSMESRVCGMSKDVAEKVLSGDLKINDAIKITKNSDFCYDYFREQDNQKLLFSNPHKVNCKDGRGYANASDKNMTRRGHQG